VTPSPPARPRAKASGFTLVEILVVMFIIGIIVTVVGLSGGNARERQALRDEAFRLQQLVTLAAEESVLGARQVGIEFQPTGYRFMLLQNQRWRLIDDGGALRPRRFDEDMALVLTVEGNAEDLAQLGVAEDALAPQVLLLSSGEATPFNVDLTNRSGGHYSLEIDAMGQVTLTDQSGES
jgi:general secretion pathway protein H